MNRIVVACVVTAALASTNVSCAASPGKDVPNAQSDQVAAMFAAGQREAARAYYVEQYGKGACPPGLAKKNNGCLPPGQARKRYAVGQVLPSGVMISAVPAGLSARIGAPPAGYTYGLVDGDLLKLAIGTRLVVDAVSAL